MLIVLWLCTLLPTLRFPDVRREILTAAGGLPVLLSMLGILGTLWADVSVSERLHGLDPFVRLLAIPLLLVQFRQTERNCNVLAGYVISCTVLLAVSFLCMAWRYAPLPPSLPRPAFLFPPYVLGVPVKDYIAQSGEFVTCIFTLLMLATRWAERKQYALMALASVLVLGFLTNIVFIITAKTSIVVLVALLILFGLKNFSAKGAALVFVCGTILAGAAWISSPYLRGRVDAVLPEIQNYMATDAPSSTGERLEWLKKTYMFLREAPVLGHGTGTIQSLFRKAAVGHQLGTAAEEATTNPHNQTAAVAIQLGLLGVAALWAMWAAHIWIFRGSGIAAWVGLIVVVQNVIGSAFNSHLFDFTQGWHYVFGVGVAGGVVRRFNQDRKPICMHSIG